jgi:DNA-binding response OmpR family regulator
MIEPLSILPLQSPKSASLAVLAREKGNGPGSANEFTERRRSARRKSAGNRVLMFGRIRELALYRAAVLRDRGFEVVTPETREQAVKSIREGSFDIVVLSYTLSNETVQELAEMVREYCPECPLIAISTAGRIDREIGPDEIVDADKGPVALIAALRRVMRPN